VELPRETVERAIGMVGALLRQDEEGYHVMADEFPGGCPMALAAVVRVTGSFIEQVAQVSQVDPETLFKRLALSIISQLDAES
jgi:hypothetical protein